MSNKVNNLTTKRFVIRKTLIGKNTIITFVNKKQVEEYPKQQSTWHNKILPSIDQTKTYSTEKIEQVVQ